MKISRPSRLTLVIGGARSGKSQYAESCVANGPPPWIYIATAEMLDGEMQERIRQHQARRDERWQTHDVPLNLASAIQELATEGRYVLVDCLTLWLSNIMHAGLDVAKECDALAESLARAEGHVVLVSNEVGFGIVPDNALARRFRDEQGRLNMKIAEVADEVVLLVAGQPLKVKSADR